MEQASFQFDLNLTGEEHAVFCQLGKGRARAVSVRDLAEQTHISERQIRDVVRTLIMQHGILVASAVDDPPGFFIAQTREEIIAATRSLRHRGIMILARVAKLQKSSLELVFNLGRLEFEGEKHETVEMR